MGLAPRSADLLALLTSKYAEASPHDSVKAFVVGRSRLLPKPGKDWRPGHGDLKPSLDHLIRLVEEGLRDR